MPIETEGCSLYIDCDNDHLSTEQLFRLLIKADGSCPAIAVVGNGGGGVPVGLATEATLQLLLTELNKDFDFELKCVRDINTDIVYILRIQKDENTGAITIDYIDATGAVVVPPVLGDLRVCDATTAITLMLQQFTSPSAYANQDISGLASTIIAANTVKSVELIVVSGTVTLGVIPYPVGVWPISGTLNGKISTALDYNATGAVAYLQTLS